MRHDVKRDTNFVPSLNGTAAGGDWSDAEFVLPLMGDNQTSRPATIRIPASWRHNDN
jgi:hypothetical protein